ncbi:peptidylprolyl isomerase [Lacimicrobium alkaliphilum]|uniref:peptidylprolyl isomerase n=1 Tax=Lacimicrobium alkaliphilum TaxID=1526571 RepID=A0ABQ1RE76_9ALTE|nr:peptidylprolyl isomerase [Lacimicrobium alkaliphilum]GGD65041.1 peptidyl-prolyl cis-trans isomerase [Lacimicrobium alkaliphilum]
MKYVLLLFFLLNSVVQADEWRTPEPENLVYLQLESGLVVIELAPFAAPEHVNQFKQLVDEGFYNGLDFYRVIEGFVAQGGDMTGDKPSESKGPLKAEFTRALMPESPFQLVQEPDFFAAQTGYIHGFAAGRDPEAALEWLVHCPGTVAMARNTDADSATTDFYVVMGQAPRHLDRNMSVFGRVIHGMEHIQALPRGDAQTDSGVIKEVAQRGRILTAMLASKLPESKRLKLKIQRTDSEAMQTRLQQGRTKDNPFFKYKDNGKLDICYYPPISRVE